MRRTLIRIAYAVGLFILTILLLEIFQDKGGSQVTAVMAEPKLPVVTMRTSSGDLYNELHGYTQLQNAGAMHPPLSIAGEDRKIRFQVDPYGQHVTVLHVQVRSTTGSRLIEDTEIRSYKTDKNGKISAEFVPKDLAQENTEYMLVIMLSTREQEDIRYYTRYWYGDEGDDTYAEAVAFVGRLHERAVSKDEQFLRTYMEPEDGTASQDYADVDINSSLSLDMWGSMAVSDAIPPVFEIAETSDGTYSIRGSILLRVTPEDADQKPFLLHCHEYYRINEGTDRYHLLEFRRTAVQVPDPQNMDLQKGRIELGIGVPSQVAQSAEKKALAYVMDGRLYGNDSENTISYIYGFMDTDNPDLRSVFDEHDIRILKVEDNGDVEFLVYGYMNRGTHEGRVGVSDMYYSNRYHTIEEQAFIPYYGSYERLKAEVGSSAYLSKNNRLYIMLSGTLYEINIAGHSTSVVEDGMQGGRSVTSDGGQMIAYQKTDGDIVLMDLSDLERRTIKTPSGSSLSLIGFFGNDLIYGISRDSDAAKDVTGITYAPMYCVKIVDPQMNELESYQQDGIYITGYQLSGSLLTIHRARKTSGADALYETAEDDQIVDTAKKDESMTILASENSSVYGTWHYLTVSGFDPEKLRYVQPKETTYQDSREITVADGKNGKEVQDSRCYVYNLYGLVKDYANVSDAIDAAKEAKGVVVDSKGRDIWKEKIPDRAEIGTVTLQQGDNPLESCLLSILSYEKSGASIVKTDGAADAIATLGQINGADVLDLTGCSLEDVLYFTAKDTPVLALRSDGAMLITGYGPSNIAVLDPSGSGKRELLTRAQAAKKFGSGTSYLAYIR